MFRRAKAMMTLFLLASGVVGFTPTETRAAGANLVVNPGFEQNLSGWTNWGGVSVVTSPVSSGAKAARMGPGESGAGQIVEGVGPNGNYVLSGRGAVSHSNEIAIIGVDLMDASGAKLPNGKFELRFDGASYTKKSLAFTTLPGTAKIQIYIYKNPNVGGYAYTDDISLSLVLNDLPNGVRAMWVWDQADIATAAKRNELIGFSLTKGVNLLYLYTGNALVTYPDRYRALIALAHANGIRIEALDGQSDWVRSANHGYPLERIRQVMNYNGASAANERFDGIHHDNEPYTLPDWETNKQSLGYDYVELARKSVGLLRSSGSPMTYSGDIPFWYETVTVTYAGTAKELYKHILDAMDYVTIMDYRDYAEGADGIIQNGANEIAYGSTLGKKVVLGVETYDVPGNPEFVTFYQEGEAYMNAELAKVNAHYAASPSYAGHAVHYYSTYKTMLP